MLQIHLSARDSTKPTKRELYLLSNGREIMMLKKYICLLLSFCIIIPLLLGSCKNNTDEEPSTLEATQENTSGKYSDYLFPNVDLENRTYCLLTLQGYNQQNYFISSNETGVILNDIAFRRTQYVNDVYNCDLIYWEGNPDLLINECLNGGTHDFDMVYPHPTSSIVKMMVSGYFTNLLTCNSLNLNAAWWNQSQVNNYSVNNKLYLAVSDYSITGQGFAAIIFNKDIYKSMGFETDLYEAVKQGTWTMEMLYTLVSAYGGNTSGDGIITADDSFGLLFQSGYAGRFMWAMDQYIFDHSEDSITLALNQEKVNGIAQKLYTLLWESDQRVFIEACTNAGWPDSDLWKIFSSNRALFMTYDIGGMFSLLSSLSFRPGYLPLPKYDSEQSDYQVICASGFFAIPTCAENFENSAMLLDTLSYISYVDMKPAFFENILGGKMSEHPDDYEMLDFLHSKKVFDLGFTMDDGGYARDLLQKLVVEGKNTNTTSYWRMYSTFIDAIASKLQMFP